MPIISIFYGIIIRMNYNDHNPPHFHADYQGFKAAIEVKTGKIIAGELPKNAQLLIKKWALKNRKVLLNNWSRAKHHQEFIRIPGEE